MADSIRKLILMDVETALNTVASLETVVPGTPEHFKFPRPIAGIIPSTEDTDLEADANEVNTLNFIVRVLVDRALDDVHVVYDLEDILADVERAVEADPARGGRAEHTRKTGVRYLYVDADLPRAGADLLFSTRYQTEESDPSVQNFM